MGRATIAAAVAAAAVLCVTPAARADLAELAQTATEGFDARKAKDFATARAKLESAIEKADALLKSAPEGPGERADALYVKATCLSVLCRFGEAGELYRELLAIEPAFGREFLPNYPDVQVELARIAFFAGDDETCRAHLEKSRGGAYVDTLEVLMETLADVEGGIGKTPDGGYVLATDVGRGGKTDKKSGKLESWTEIAQTLDLVRKAYEKVLPKGTGDRDLVSRVYVFANAADFDAFAKKTGGAKSESAFGYYDPDFKVLVVHEANDGEALGPLSAGTWSTLLHEAVHQFIDMSLLGAPIWYQEGLAEYFGPSRIEVQRKKKLLKIGVNPRLSDMDYILNPGKYQDPDKAPKAKPLEKLVTDPAAWEGSPGDYAQAWSLVYYLQQGVKGGDKRLAAYWKELADGKSAKEATAKAFKGVKWAALEQGWRDFVTQLAEKELRGK